MERMCDTFSTRFDLLHNMVIFTAYIKPHLKWTLFGLHVFDIALSSIIV